MIKKSVNLEEELAEMIEKLPNDSGINNFSYNLKFIVETWFTLIRYSKANLNGYFTSKEAYLIVDALNGQLLTTGLSFVKTLYFSVEDAIKLEQLDKKWKVDREELLKKLEELSESEALAVYLMVFDFWNSSDHSENSLKKIFMISED